MQVLPKWLKKGWVYAPMLFSAAIQTGCSTPGEDSSRLVQAMRLDSAVLLSFVLPLKSSIASGVTKPDSTDPAFKLYLCLAATPSSIFTPTIADRFTRSMSSEEIKRAIAFFESLPGKKYTQNDLSSVPEYLKLPPEPNITAVALTAADNASIAAFSKTPEGTKLLIKNILDDEATQKLLISEWQKTIEECRQKIQNS